MNRNSQYEMPQFFYNNDIRIPQVPETPDSFVLRYDGKYYLYFTCGGRKMYAMVSTDLLHYELIDNHILEKGVIYDYDKDANHPDSESPFAPEVCYYDGYFYMVSSPSGNGHYLFRSESPEGPFSCITGNIDRKIDGSFFLDSDEKPYLYAAFDDSLKVYSLSDDFTNVGEKETFLAPCHLGRWNEGPYMLKRYGTYYLTYCGAHFLSTDYRVDYATIKDGSNLFDASSYTRQDTILCSTEKDFYGLGHSCTVLGPDLDSYFLIYHNLTPGKRFYNLSRLSFYGNRLAINGVRLKDIPFVKKAYSVKDGDGLILEKDCFLLDKTSDETFSVEFNNVGKGRMLFSYLDDNHYGFLDFDGKSIILGKKNYTEEILKEITLRKEYRTDVLHSFLLQYRNGFSALYFDHIEKLYAFPCQFDAGKVGYFANNVFNRICSTSLSSFAMGSSEEYYFKDKHIFANSFFKEKSKNVSPTSPYVHLCEGKRASYLIDVPEDGKYTIYLTLKSGYKDQSLLIQKENGLIYPILLKDESGKDEDTVPVIVLSLDKGPQLITLIGEGDISFAEITLEKLSSKEDILFDFTKELDNSKFFFRKAMHSSLDGYHTSDNDLSSGLLYDKSLSSEYCELSLVPNDIADDGSISLIFHSSEFCNNFIEDGDTADNPTSYRGFSLDIRKDAIVLRKIDFNYSIDLVSYSYSYNPGQELHLALYQDDETLSALLNGEKILSYHISKGNHQGMMGFLAYKASAVLKEMLIKSDKD